MKHGNLTFSRRIVQGAGLALGLLGIVLPGMTHILFPGLHCYACPLSVTICPVGIIQNLLKSGFPYYPIAFLGLYGLAAGRWWCGWVCPFGLVNDLFSRLSRKSPIPLMVAIIGAAGTLLLVSIGPPPVWAILPGIIAVTAFITYLVPLFKEQISGKLKEKWMILLLFTLFILFFPVVLVLSTGNLPVLLLCAAVFLILTGVVYFIYLKKKGAFYLKFLILMLTIVFAVIAGDTIFCKLCPSATISAALPYPFQNSEFLPGTMYWVKLAILLLVIGAMLMISRFFCRYLCPLGALFGLTNKISALKILRTPACDTDKKGCRLACVRACPMGIKDIHKKQVLTQTDCIKCGKCIEECPHSNLKFKWN